jgi:GNAT superfamily N-acetyltransferase
MTEPITITPLTRADIPAAVESLAAAFVNYPLLAAPCPDTKRRPRVVEAFCRYLVHMSLRCEGGYATADRAAVVCTWPPGWEWPSRWTSLCTGFFAVLWRLGWKGSRWLIQIEHEFDESRLKHVPGPHWYVPLLGVRPDAQGRGLSRAVLRPVFEAADRDRVPIYLETMTEATVPVYKRLGFELRGHRKLTGDLPNWELVRQPQGD